MNDFFEAWQARHQRKGYGYFVRDGIVNPKAWSGASLKICFFLKEAYQRDSDCWDMTRWLCNEEDGGGAVKKMWHTVAECTYGMLNTTAFHIPSYADAARLNPSQKSELLQHIAVVNVKKSGGLSSSVWSDLLIFAQEDRDLLKRQIEGIAPDVIVCGNNSSLLRVIYGATVDMNGQVLEDGEIGGDLYRQMSKKGYAWQNGRLIIDFYHPANHFPKMMNYYTLCCLYQQALKEKSDCS